MTAVEFSIIIVNWNTQDLLRACLQSIQAQVQTAAVEVIVVDNASGDNSGRMVATQFPWVTLIVNQENLGFSKANNQGMRHSRGQYLILLNSDTCLLNDISAIFQQVFDQQPDVGLIGAKLITPDNTPQRWVRGKMLSLQTAINHYLFLSEIFPQSRFFQGIVDNTDYPTLTDVDWVSGACLAIRRSVLDQVGLLDESVFMYNEDMELCHRVKQAGYRVVYAPQAQVKHFVSQSLARQTSEAVLSAPIFSQDALYRRLNGKNWLFLFRAVVGLGTFIRYVIRLIVFALRPGDRSRYRLHEAKRNARTAWQLWRGSNAGGDQPGE